MPPVGGGVEDDVVGPALDAAFEHRLERFVGGVLGVEGEVVAEHEKAERRAAQQRHQVGQALDVLAVDLDELQQPGILAEARIDRGMGGLDQRRLAHAARAPQQRVVGGQAAAKRSVFSIRMSRMRSMPLRSDMSTRLTRGTGASLRRIGIPDEGVGDGEIGRFRRLRREPLQRRRDALENVGVGDEAGELLGADMEQPFLVAPHSGAGARPQAGSAVQKMPAMSAA